LRTRLNENTFASGGLVDLSGPVLRLENLSREDMYILLQNLRRVFARGDEDAYLLPDEGLHAFMHHCESRVGDSYFRTPRTTVKAFLDLLAVLEQNPGTPWSGLIQRVEIAPETNPDLAPLEDADTPRCSYGDDGLVAVKL